MTEEQPKVLSSVEDGQVVELVSIEASHGLRNRLASMGLLPKVTFKVVSNRQSGPVVINVRGTKVVLGRGMAEKIIIK